MYFEVSELGLAQKNHTLQIKMLGPIRGHGFDAGFPAK
jgi:hypothetical protein